MSVDPGAVLLGFMQAMRFGEPALDRNADPDAALALITMARELPIAAVKAWPLPAQGGLLLLLRTWMTIDEWARMGGSPFDYPPDLLDGSGSTRLGPPAVSWLREAGAELRRLDREIRQARRDPPGR